MDLKFFGHRFFWTQNFDLQFLLHLKVFWTQNSFEQNFFVDNIFTLNLLGLRILIRLNTLLLELIKGNLILTKMQQKDKNDSDGF